MLRLINTLLLAAAATGCNIHQARPDVDRMTADVGRLREAFPTLERLAVTEYDNYRDWCHGLAYRGGAFATSLEPETCIYADPPPVAFDAAAATDFQDVRAAFGSTGVLVGTMWAVRYDASGHLAFGHFGLIAGDFDRFSYVYDPGAPLPEQLPNELEYTRITPDWYFEWEDWN